MIEIDGSYGEGGGQILRNAIALSILTNKPVTINNIRANRPNPGIKPQHHTVLTILKTLSKAETSGLSIGSSKIVFSPTTIQSGTFRFDVGTAGSMVLIYEALLFACLKIKSPLSIELTGGSDVKWAPSWDYFVHVFLPFLHTIGIQTKATLYKRGYYPKGGGHANLLLQPTEAIIPFSHTNSRLKHKIKGTIHSNQLPDHISQRMKDTTINIGREHDYAVHISTEHTATTSPGVVMTLWADNSSRYLGCVGLGEKGISSEKIGNDCIVSMIDLIKREVIIDSRLCDQIIGFLCCCKGTSTILTPTLSNHTKTNMWLIERFFSSTSLFEVTTIGNNIQIKVHGQDILKK